MSLLLSDVVASLAINGSWTSTWKLHTHTLANGLTTASDRNSNTRPRECPGAKQGTCHYLNQYQDLTRHMASLGHNKAYIPLHHNLWRNLYTIITSRDSSVKWFHKNIKRVGFTFMDIHYNPDGCSSFHWLPACNMKLGYKNQSCHGVNAVTVNAFFDSNATHADILSQTFLMVSIRIMVYQNTDLILCQIWQGHEYGNEKCENVILHLMVLKHYISFLYGHFYLNCPVIQCIILDSSCCLKTGVESDITLEHTWDASSLRYDDCCKCPGVYRRQAISSHHSEFPATAGYTVKPVYNDHLMGYFSAFWSTSRWPRAT